MSKGKTRNKNYRNGTRRNFKANRNPRMLKNSRRNFDSFLDSCKEDGIEVIKRD